MIEYKFSPRFNDTDALGHINNAVYATWFEEGRREFLSYFVPNLDPKAWNLIVARIEIDYVAQGHYQFDALVKSSVEKIGNSSFVIYQEAFQEGALVAKGKAFLVHFDYKASKSVPIPEAIRAKLTRHLVATA